MERLEEEWFECRPWAGGRPGVGGSELEGDARRPERRELSDERRVCWAGICGGASGGICSGGGEARVEGMGPSRGVDEC